MSDQETTSFEADDLFIPGSVTEAGAMAIHLGLAEERNPKSLKALDPEDCMFDPNDANTFNRDDGYPAPTMEACPHEQVMGTRYGRFCYEKGCPNQDCPNRAESAEY